MQPGRDAADGSEVGGDVVAGGAIAAGGAAGEDAFLIAQIHGHAVHFWFHHPIELFVWQQALHAIDKFAEFLLRIGVVEAQHRLEVPDWLECLERLAANALGWENRA